MKTLDFRNAPFGLLVRRSQHQLRENPSVSSTQVGIMTGREFFEESSKGRPIVVCFPCVHWEGETMATLCHPANVTPVRRHVLPTIEVEP